MQIDDTSSTPTHNSAGANKDAQVIDGCRRLQARQRLGQSFSSREIARECGVQHRIIMRTERQALRKVAYALAGNKGICAELFGDKPMREIFKGIDFNVGLESGKGYPKPKKVTPKKATKYRMTLEEVAKQVQSSRPKRVFNAPL